MITTKQLFSRHTPRPASATRRTTELPFERIEDRLNMSGFGPEDGALIVESWAGTYDEVRIQPSGQILAAGADISANTVTIARYGSQGDVDGTYGVGGRSTPALGTGTESANGLAFQANGMAVISYYRTSNQSSLQHGVARFKANGSLDTSFGGGGWSIVDVRTTDSTGTQGSVGLQSTGKIVMAASSNVIFPSASPWGVVARFGTSGALDSGKNAFGDVKQGKSLGYSVFSSTAPSGPGGFLDNMIQPDDKVVVVGKTTATNGTDGSFTVARYTASGALDTSFNGTGYGNYTPAGSINAWARSVAQQVDGKIVVVGNYGGSDGTFDIFVARLNANGTLDTTFGSGTGFATWDFDGAATATQENANDVAIAADGKIVVTGDSYSASDYYQSNYLAVGRFNTDGSPDATFGSGGFKLIAAPSGHSLAGTSISLQVDGSVIVAGYNSDGTTYHPILARFYGSASPLMAASAPSAAVNQSLTSSQVQPILAEGIARWKAAGEDVSSLKNVSLQIAALPGNLLGQAMGQTLTLDSNADGWGWFIDKSPKNDSEFSTRGNQGEQNRIDLLTVVMHELGHLLGKDHDEGGMMAETLATGVRQTEVGHDHVTADHVTADHVFGSLSPILNDLWLNSWLNEQYDSTPAWTKRRR